MNKFQRKVTRLAKRTCKQIGWGNWKYYRRGARVMVVMVSARKRMRAKLNSDASKAWSSAALGQTYK